VLAFGQGPTGRQRQMQEGKGEEGCSWRHGQGI
jgi:hypothetical protein